MRFPKLLLTFAILLCLNLSFQSANAQTQKGILSDGSDFYIAQLTPSLAGCSQLNPYQSYWVLISSFYDCSVKVSYFQPDGTEVFTSTKQVMAKRGIQVPLDQSFMNPRDANGNPINPQGQVPEYTSCHIHSTRPISVSFYSTGPNSGSLYMALQTGALGKTYVTAAMPANPGLGKATGFRATCPDDSGSSEFAVIAVQDNTAVTITPNGLTRQGNVGVSCGQGATGVPERFSTTLNRGQVYWVKSTNDDMANDLSGSIVHADKPVAVIAGCESAFNGETALSVQSDEQRNMSVEQMIPVDFWTDKDYVSMPTAQDPNEPPSDGSAGNQYKIFTYNPGTNLTVAITKISPYLSVPLDPFECPPLTYENVEDGIDISSNNLPGADTGNKIMVEEYQYRQMSGGQANPSLAPEQMNIIPLSRFRKSYMWQVPDNKFYQRQRRYINVIAQRSQLNHIFLIYNGGAPASLSALPSASGNVSIPYHPELVGRSYEVTGGAYYAYGDSAFAVYQFGDLGYDLDHDLGDNDGDDYFFSYMSTCGLSLGIDGASTPTMSVDTICGGQWNLRVVDDNPLDNGISSIDLLNDPNGVLKRKPGTDSGYVSQNVDFNPVNFTVIPGDTVVTVPINVDNPLQDAWAYVWVVNGAGNDTVIYLHYTAPKLSFLSDQGPNDDSINFLNSSLGADTCARMVFKNLGGEKYHITGYHFAEGGQGFRVSGTTPVLPATMAPGDSVVFDVCFNAAQAGVYRDTLIVETDCPKALAPLFGSTQVGEIEASDWDFLQVPIGQTSCHTVRVSNIGAAPFTLTKGWLLDNDPPFSFGDDAKLPVVIEPGKFVDLTMCYTPTQDQVEDTATQTWGSDIPEPFTPIRKDFSGLRGIGVKPALAWDTNFHALVTQCDTPKIIRCTLHNYGTAQITVDTVKVQGPDSAEFLIIGNQDNYTPLNPMTRQFIVYPQGDDKFDTTQWVDVQFTPDLSKPLPDRWADRHDTLIASSQDSIHAWVALYIEVHHAQVDLSQSSVDLGMTKPGVPTPTKKITVTNSGDAPLIIQQLTVDTPFTIVQPGSLMVGDTIMPGLSDTVTIQGVMSWNGSDTGFLTIAGTTPLCSTNQSMFTMSASSIEATAQGANVTPTYICMSNVDSVSASAGLTSVPVRIDSAQIIDDPSDIGGSADFTFSSTGTHTFGTSYIVNAGMTQKYGVIYTPSTKLPETSDVIFTFDTASNPGVAPWTETVKITGTGLQEHTVLSVQNPQPGPYTAGTSSGFQMPIQMTMPIAGGADIHSISMDITFKRDLFDPLSPPVVALSPYTVLNSTLDQTTDPAVLHVTIGRADGQPFDSTAVLANLQFKVMVAKDTTTNVVVSNVQFQNSAGSDVCYVLHDTIPASFNPKYYCGDDMLRRLLETGQVSLGIRDVHPNPATNTVHVGLDIREDGVPMTIELYNALGQLVRSYGHGAPMPAGLQGMDLDLSGVPSGAYSLRILTPDYTVARTLVVQK
ncbi:MAG TPA: choice-of-anchor D domain-containing protein [Candidatus Kapabacteria bacterium]|nr:choice-of-anchor D domain-containing protein [Candidatus Kapabacteria bacterium]